MTIKEITPHHIYVQVPNKVGTRLDGVYVKSKQSWRLPLNLGALRDLHLLGYDVLELGNRLSNEYKEIVARKSSSSVVCKEDALREYQQQDVHFLVNLPYAGIFNQQRTGKSVITCRVIEQIGERAAVVCPASLVLNWRDEINNWTNLEPIVVMGTKKNREKLYKQYLEKGGVLILGKEVLRNDISLIQNLNIHNLVVDEAHFLRNRSTKQTEALISLARITKRRYALTGTPATSSPADVYGILHFLDPARWTSYWQFVERYFNITQSHWGGGAKEVGTFKSAARKREYEEILNVLSVQRKRKDVMQWLPDKQYQTIKLKMTKAQQKAYDEMRTTFEVEEVGLDASTILTQILRLRQITSVPAVLGLDDGAKMEFILEWLSDNPDEKVLIFSNFSSGLKLMKDVLEAKKYKVGMLIGEIPKVQRDQYVRSFQSGIRQILLCNIEAAGTGLTLDAASTVIFLDRHYNVSSNEQAEDRIIATQEGRNLKAHIIDLACENSIDEKILELVKQKKNVTDYANNYKEWLK